MTALTATVLGATTITTATTLPCHQMSRPIGSPPAYRIAPRPLQDIRPSTQVQSWHAGFARHQTCRTRSNQHVALNLAHWSQGFCSDLACSHRSGPLGYIHRPHPAQRVATDLEAGLAPQLLLPQSERTNLFSSSGCPSKTKYRLYARARCM